MTLEEVKNAFPALAARLPEDIFTDRELVVVDDNYVEAEGEETEEFDSSVYNYILYIAAPTLSILEEKGLAELTARLENFEHFERITSSEEDLFGIYSNLDEAQISRAVFSMIEEIIS